jgi:AraC-like DNA-binding protein
LYVVDVDLPPSCEVTAWRPGVPGITEVFHAHMVGYRYPAHCHGTWAVCIVDDGAVSYDLETRWYGAPPGSVIVLPPGVTHTGYPSGRQYRKREFYFDGDFLPESLIGPAVDRSSLDDRPLRAALDHLHRRLVPERREPLDVESRLAFLAERLRRHFTPGQPAPAEPEPTLASQLRDFLDGRLTEKVTLAEAAALFDRTVPHLVRGFTRRYGISPHAYLTGRRVERARTLLLQGIPVADVAVEVGFHDQAHLTRHFRRHVGVPPARYAARA